MERRILITPEGGLIRFVYGQLEVYGQPVPIYGTKAKEAIEQIQAAAKENTPVLLDNETVKILRFPQLVAITFGNRTSITISGKTFMVNKQEAQTIIEEAISQSPLNLVKEILSRIEILEGKLQEISKEGTEATENTEKLKEEIQKLNENIRKLQEVYNLKIDQLQQFIEELKDQLETLKKEKEKQSSETQNPNTTIQVQQKQQNNKQAPSKNPTKNSQNSGISTNQTKQK